MGFFGLDPQTGTSSNGSTQLVLVRIKPMLEPMWTAQNGSNSSRFCRSVELGYLRPHRPIRYVHNRTIFICGMNKTGHDYIYLFFNTENLKKTQTDPSTWPWWSGDKNKMGIFRYLFVPKGSKPYMDSPYPNLNINIHNVSKSE